MKPFTTLAAALFSLMALVHLYRLVSRFDVMVMGHAVPVWLNVVGLVVAGVMALGLLREAKR